MKDGQLQVFEMPSWFLAFLSALGAFLAPIALRLIWSEVTKPWIEKMKKQKKDKSND